MAKRKSKKTNFWEVVILITFFILQFLNTAMIYLISKYLGVFEIFKQHLSIFLK